MNPAGTVTHGLLVVHAHPDDESITTGGTIAHYRKRGLPVTVVTCTLGEEGEVIGDEYAHLVAGQADQLGGYRILELTRALAELMPGRRTCWAVRAAGATPAWPGRPRRAIRAPSSTPATPPPTHWCR